MKQPIPFMYTTEKIDNAEMMISKYREYDYTLLTEEIRKEYISDLLYSHDYLLERVKYLEEERFKNA